MIRKNLSITNSREASQKAVAMAFIRTIDPSDIINFDLALDAQPYNFP